MKIKRIDIFLLKTFLPLFIMTFGISLFIVLMQFLWKYVDEMVGKGIEMSILAEVFFYSALTLVPMALPIAILLASLMTFGNLGEQFELLAIKASGISLLRLMRPLTVFLCIIAVGAFYFQNNIIPLSQVKMWTLMYSMRSKSPELDIPESTFYGVIEGYNLMAMKKDKTGLLKEVMIYDYTDGFNNLQVTVADSGRIKMTADKLYLILYLYNGESFANIKTQERNNPNDAVPYQKVSFQTREIFIKFDANFNRMSESVWQNRFIGKNLAELRHSIDSMSIRLDSVKMLNSKQLYEQSNQRLFNINEDPPVLPHQADVETTTPHPDFDQIYLTKQPGTQLALLSQVKAAIESIRTDYVFKSNMLASEEKEMRRHHTEMHQKFTFSFACLVFFFIGAPLGAIIRKGGLGMPVVISVVLFIFYHIISNIGYKMATNGIWLPWQGMWLSSAVLLPLGIFLTYKAANDSVILNIDTYIEGLKKLIGKRTLRKIEKKEIILYNIDYQDFFKHINELKDECTTYLTYNKQWMPYFIFWKQGCKDIKVISLSERLENLIEEGRNSDKNIILNKLMDYPIIEGYEFNFRINEKTSTIIGYFFPLSIFFYLFTVYRRRFLIHHIQTISQTCDELIAIIQKN